MEATLRNVAWNIGGQVQDVVDLECRTTVCRAMLVLDPSIDLLNDDEKQQVFDAQLHRFIELMVPVLNSSDRLRTLSAAQIRPELPGEQWRTVLFASSMAAHGPGAEPGALDNANRR
jgi:hypothetical protein